MPPQYDVEVTDTSVQAPDLSDDGAEDSEAGFDFLAAPPDMGPIPDFELDDDGFDAPEVEVDSSIGEVAAPEAREPAPAVEAPPVAGVAPPADEEFETVRD